MQWGATEPRLKRRVGDVAAERSLICLFDDDRSHHLGMDGAQKVVGAGCVEVGRENVVLIAAEPKSPS